MRRACTPAGQNEVMKCQVKGIGAGQADKLEGVGLDGVAQGDKIVAAYCLGGNHFKRAESDRRVFDKGVDRRIAENSHQPLFIIGEMNEAGHRVHRRPGRFEVSPNGMIGQSSVGDWINESDQAILKGANVNPLTIAGDGYPPRPAANTGKVGGVGAGVNGPIRPAGDGVEHFVGVAVNDGDKGIGLGALRTGDDHRPLEGDVDFVQLFMNGYAFGVNRIDRAEADFPLLARNQFNRGAPGGGIVTLTGSGEAQEDGVGSGGQARKGSGDGLARGYTLQTGFYAIVNQGGFAIIAVPVSVLVITGVDNNLAVLNDSGRFGNNRIGPFTRSYPGDVAQKCAAGDIRNGNYDRVVDSGTGSEIAYITGDHAICGLTVMATARAGRGKGDISIESVADNHTGGVGGIIIGDSDGVG